MNLLSVLQERRKMKKKQVNKAEKEAYKKGYKRGMEKCKETYQAKWHFVCGKCCRLLGKCACKKIK